MLENECGEKSIPVQIVSTAGRRVGALSQPLVLRKEFLGVIAGNYTGKWEGSAGLMITVPLQLSRSPINVPRFASTSRNHRSNSLRSGMPAFHGSCVTTPSGIP